MLAALPEMLCIQAMGGVQELRGAWEAWEVIFLRAGKVLLPRCAF